MAVRIFVAGDSPKNVELIKTTFARLGHEIIPVNGVALGLFLAHKSFPHVIICDLKMIDGTGMEFLSQVKLDPDLSGIPFLFLCSSACNGTVKDEATALGAEKVLYHPISPEELSTELDPYLREHQEEREPETPE
jgi:CheY-like chemotaxis protein